MRHRSEGIALITVLLVMTVVAVLAFGTVFTTQIELRIARNDATFTQANYAAQTGLEKYKTALFQSFRWLADYSSGSGNISGDACSDRFTDGLYFSRELNPDGSPKATPWDTDASGNKFLEFGPETVFASDGVTPIGEFTVWVYRDSDVDDYYIVRSVGNSSGATATVEAVLEVSTGGVLTNAVFAGVGGGNDKFNGGATIRGGVYIYGEGDEFADPPVTDQDAPVFDTNGNFAVYNDYDLRGVAYGDVKDRVASATEPQLCASFRIADGQLDLGSSAVSIGSKSNPLLGLYVDDGVSDILTRRNTDVTDSCKQNGGVCANNIGAFDLDVAPELPKLRSSSGGGSLVEDEHCSASPSYWEDCIREGLSPGGITSRVFGPDGNLTFSECIDTFVVNDTLVFGAEDVSCTATVDGRKYGFEYKRPSSSTNSSSVGKFLQYGDLAFSDINVRFANSVEYSVTGYEGGSVTGGASFAVLRSVNSTTGGDVLFDGSFVVDPGTTIPPRVWPEQVISIIAENEVRQRGDHVMAQTYAGYRFRTEGQNVLYGQVITDEFCTTSAGQDACNAGQSSEVIYLNPGMNSPRHFRNIDPAGGGETFRVLSYNLR